MDKPRIAVHKFSSCDGCQLAFLNLGETLLELSRMVEIVHFAEAGPVNPEAQVDIAFVEGSVSTPDELERIERIRANSTTLITIGACATAGGLQALRNLGDSSGWSEAIYAQPKYIHSMATATAIREHVKVDLELWGCPITSDQLLMTIRALLFGVKPWQENEKLCMECKRQQSVCVMVTQDRPCLGPVTRAGCGALCPRFGRDCYGCFGPGESANPAALGQRFAGLGLLPEAIANRFLFINSAVEPLRQEGLRWRERGDE